MAEKKNDVRPSGVPGGTPEAKATEKIGPFPVQGEQVVAYGPGAETELPPKPVRTATELLDYLAAEKSPWASSPACRDAVRLLKPQTAEDVVKLLADQYERNRDLQGTYHKAMRWLHGAEWSPLTGNNPTELAEENKQLRLRLAHLESEVRTLNAHLIAERKLLRSLEDDARAARGWRMNYGEDRPGIRQVNEPELKPGVTAGTR